MPTPALFSMTTRASADCLMKLVDESLHALLATRETAGVHQILPDRHGIAALPTAGGGKAAEQDGQRTSGRPARRQLARHFFSRRAG